jgi:hypothetical protein
MSHPLSQNKPKGGAPKGNRNAWKYGGWSGEWIARRRDLRTKTRALVAETDLLCQIALALHARRFGHDAAQRRNGS